MTDKPDAISRIKQTLEEKPGNEPKNRRSALFILMLSKMDRFEKMASKRSWWAMADTLNAQGITTADGRPLTAERIRKTWWAVRDHVKTRDQKPAPPMARPMPADEKAARTPTGRTTKAKIRIP